MNTLGESDLDVDIHPKTSFTSVLHACRSCHDHHIYERGSEPEQEGDRMESNMEDNRCAGDRSNGNLVDWAG